MKNLFKIMLLCLSVALISCSSEEPETPKDYRTNFLGTWYMSGSGELKNTDGEALSVNFENKMVRIVADPDDDKRVLISGFFDELTGRVMLDTNNEPVLLIDENSTQSSYDNGVLTMVTIEHILSKIVNGELKWNCIWAVVMTNGKKSYSFTGLVDCTGTK